MALTPPDPSAKWQQLLDDERKRSAALQERLSKLEADRQRHRKELQRLRASVDRESNSRLMAEEALDQTQGRLALAAEAARLGLWEWWIDRDGIDVDARAGTLMGLPSKPNTLTPAQCASWVDTSLSPMPTAALVAALKGERERFVAELFLRHPGKTGWVELHGMVVARDLLGRATRMIGTVSGIDERKQTEQRLAAALKEAREASRAKGEFLANMSHEVRTPLNGILGLTRLLADSDLSAEQGAYLRMVEGSAKLLLGLLNDTLDYSKLEAGRMTLAPSAFDLPQAVDEVLMPFRMAAQEKGLALQVEVAPDLPTMVLGDGARLQQVLGNLVSNAIKFTDQGWVRLRIARGNDKDQVAFEVADSGIGISRDRQEAVFEAFQQADSSITRRYGGTGLGLAICHRLVTMMGGVLSLTSHPGRGSAFSFALPLPAAQSTRVGAAPGEGVPPFDGLSVLLVEDHPVNLLIMQRTLERMGCRVCVARDGREAVAQWQRQRPGLVLMDVQMPVMSGLDATREIRAQELQEGRQTTTPIIALTAHAAPADRQRSLDAGMNDHLVKPVTPDALGLTMARCLGRGTDASKAKPGVREAASRPEPALDVNAMMARLGGDRDLALEVAQAMQDDLARRLTALREASRQRDAAAVCAQAHALKGALASVMAARAALLAKGLEASARQGSWALLDKALPLFEAEAARVSAALAAFTTTPVP
jgi:signal transduction histidine kinase/CheY-like chemotaxis protein